MVNNTFPGLRNNITLLESMEIIDNRLIIDPGQFWMPGYATTRTIDALEEKQFVARQKDDCSRRSYRIYLTDQSRRIIPELFIIVKKVNEQLLSVLSLTQRKHLTAILKKLALAKPG